MFSMPPRSAIDNANTLFQTFHPKMRAISWESCFALFQKAWSGKPVPPIDLARELFAYLGSFGMFHNSSLLLVHYSAFVGSCHGKRPLIDVLMDPKFAVLRAPASIHVGNVPLVVELATEIRDSLYGAYQDCVPPPLPNPPTSTMVTKIILGTFGATPAYDTRVVSNLRIYGGIQTFGQKSLEDLYRYYADLEHFALFESWRKSHPLITVPSLVYPEMRFLDMALW